MPTRIVVTTSPRLHVDRGDGNHRGLGGGVPGRISRPDQSEFAGMDGPTGSGDGQLAMKNVAVLRAESVAAEDLFFRVDPGVDAMGCHAGVSGTGTPRRILPVTRGVPDPEGIPYEQRLPGPHTLASAFAAVAEPALTIYNGNFAAVRERTTST